MAIFCFGGSDVGEGIWEAPYLGTSDGWGSVGERDCITWAASNLFVSEGFHVGCHAKTTEVNWVSGGFSGD